MKKKTYILLCVAFLIILSFNLSNDRYQRTFLNESMKISKASDSDRYSATIYGDGTNAGTFAKGPNVYLNKGDYKVTVHYRTDTDKNYVRIGSKINGKEMELSEEDSCLYYDQTTKVFTFSSIEDIPKFQIKIDFGGQGTFVLESIEIENTGRTNNDTLFMMVVFLILFIAIGILAYGKNIKNRKEKITVAFILGIITICASYPLFSNTIIYGHDIKYHLGRIEGIKSGLLAGQFPVRIHSDIFGGYGYASSMFYPELFLYIPAILRILGVTLVTSVQVFLVLTNFMTALFMYLAAYKMSKSRQIGMISSALYVLSIYHLCDMYTRFAIGETIAMAFLPLIIYGMYELLYGDATKWNYAVIGITGALQSHILTIIFTIPLVIIVTIICIKRVCNKSRLLAIIKALAACVLLNIWFIVPFVQMMKEDINLDNLKRTVADNALYVSQLFESFTNPTGGRNVIGTGTASVMPVHIGIFIIVGTVLCIYNIISHNIEKEEDKKVSGTLILFGVFTAYATTYLFPWEFLQGIPLIGDIVSMVQFPWRLLAYSTVFLSMAAAYGIYYAFQNVELKKAMVAVSILASIIPAAMFLDTFNTGKITLYRGEGISSTEIASGEYFYTGTSISLSEKRGDLVEASSDKLLIRGYSKKNGKVQMDIENTSGNPEYIEVPLLYYPGYIAVLDSDTRLNIEKGNDNVLRVDVPTDSNGTVLIQYRGRKLWDICTIISILTAITLIAWPYKDKIKDKFGKKNYIFDN